VRLEAHQLAPGQEEGHAEDHLKEGGREGGRGERLYACTYSGGDRNRGREESTYHRHEFGGILALELLQVRHVGPHEVGGEEVVEPKGAEVQEGGQGTPDLGREGGSEGGREGGREVMRQL